MGGRHDEADGGDEKDGGEDVADPGEAGEEAEAGGDEGSAHEDGSEDSPEEDAGLLERLDLEEAKKKQEDEEVIDGERLFDRVAGEVLDGGLAAEGAKDEEREGEGGGDPEGGGDDGSTVGFGWRRGSAAPGVEELKREQYKQKEMEADPMADGGGIGHVLGCYRDSGPACT
jgi:hypothetical protein